MVYKMPKSKRGAWRQYDAIIRQYQRDFAGGGLFGWDMPTLRINAPDKYNHIMAMKEIFSSLPD